MKLNCDMGESFGSWKMGMDEQIMPHVDMANIACGFHASDPHTMQQTVALAAANNVTIGAHPGFPDLQGFGRKDMHFSFNELVNIVLYQVGALQALCKANNTQVSYVKPHGALYNMMMRDQDVFKAMVKAVALLESDIPLMIMATAEHQEYSDIAEQENVSLLFEAFCDRAYTDEGRLQPRGIEGAVYHDLDSIVNQATQMIQQGTVTTCTGKTLSIKADTICIHGDGELALPSVETIRGVLAAS